MSIDKGQGYTIGTFEKDVIIRSELNTEGVEECVCSGTGQNAYLLLAYNKIFATDGPRGWGHNLNLCWNR